MCRQIASEIEKWLVFNGHWLLFAALDRSLIQNSKLHCTENLHFVNSYWGETQVTISKKSKMVGYRGWMTWHGITVFVESLDDDYDSGDTIDDNPAMQQMFPWFPPCRCQYLDLCLHCLWNVIQLCNKFFLGSHHVDVNILSCVTTVCEMCTTFD